MTTSILLLLVLFFYKQPLWRLPAIVAAAPWYTIRLLLFGLPTTLLEIVVLAVVTSFFLHLWDPNQRQSFVDTLRTAPILTKTSFFLFFLSSILAVSLAPHVWTGFGLWRAYFLEPLFVGLIAMYDLRNNKVLPRVLALSATSSLVVSGIALWQWFHPEGILVAGQTFWAITDPIWSNPVTRRSTSIFGYPNAIALYLAPLLPLYAFSIFTVQPMRHRRLVQGFFGVTIVASLLAILAARSHGALGAMLLGLVTLILLTQSRARIVKILGSTLLFGSLILPWTTTTLEGFTFQKPSGQVRLEQWKETTRLLRDKPLTGGGFANYQTAILPYHSAKIGAPFLYPHSLALNFWTELGLFGLVTFLLTLLALGKTLVNAVSEHIPRLTMAPFLISSFVIILTHGLVDVPYFKNDLSVLYWFMSALVVYRASN